MRTQSICRVFLQASALYASLFAGTAIAQPATFDNKRLASGADASGPPHVKVFNGLTFAPLQDFFAYDTGFTGGVRVALGDVNGDGTVDLVTATGTSANAHVKVFDAASQAEIRSFFPFGGFPAGVHVAAGDVNGDGFADIIVGAGDAAPPFLRVFDGRTGAMFRDIDAFDSSFAGGVRVAAGDVNGDGFADIIVAAGAGALPHVKAFDGRNMDILHNFNAYPASFSGGVYVAAGDVDGDGRADIITGAGAGAGATVKIFPGPSHGVPATFNAYAAGFTGGIFVAGPVLNNTLLRDGFE